MIAKLVLELDDSALAEWVERIYEDDECGQPDVRDAVLQYLDEKAGDELNHALWPDFGLHDDPKCLRALRIEIDGELLDGGWSEDE